MNAETELYQYLGLAGDDAAEFLDEVHKRFGTIFSDFRFDDFFPSEAHILSFLGGRNQKKSLTLGHLAQGVERGRWV